MLTPPHMPSTDTTARQHCAPLARWSLAVFGLILGVSIGAPAAADDYYSETRAARGEDHAHADGLKHIRALDESFSGHIDVADQLQRLPELRVRRVGGSNTPAYVSIRGSEHNAVGIFLDGVPLNGGHQSSVSLNAVLPEMLSDAEVYRSNAPLSLGSNLPGG